MWTVRFTQDTKDPGIGSLSAHFQDDVTGDSFTYAEGRVDQKDFSAFILAAQQGLAKYQAERANVVAIEQKIAGALNG